MSELTTPIVDSCEFTVPIAGKVIGSKTARRLERERDEAREAAAKWESLFSTLERAGAEQARRADENREWALRAERERDEAREELADWENASAHVEANHPDEVHCGCVPVLRKLLIDARKERDEARDKAEKSKAYKRVLKETNAQLDRYKRQWEESRTETVEAVK